MSTKHTPGPWIVDDKHVHAAGYVYASPIVDDDLVVEVNTDTRPGGLLTEMDKANLKLIAAAPDLLEALEGLLKATRKAAAVAEMANDEYADTDAHFVGEWIDQAREAIAKATT